MKDPGGSGGGSSLSLVSQLSFYGAYHANRWNQLIHFFFVSSRAPFQMPVSGPRDILDFRCFGHESFPCGGGEPLPSSQLGKRKCSSSHFLSLPSYTTVPDGTAWGPTTSGSLDIVGRTGMGRRGEAHRSPCWTCVSPSGPNKVLVGPIRPTYPCTPQDARSPSPRQS